MKSSIPNFWEKEIDSGPKPKNGERFDIIIVGGGPAGSASACYAALEGNKVLLIEKSS